MQLIAALYNDGRSSNADAHNLPLEAILLSALAQVALGFLVRLVLLIGVLAYFRVAPPLTAFLFPIGIFSLVLVGLSWACCSHR